MLKLTRKIKELGRRIAFYFRRDRFDRELDAEIRFHLEMKAREKTLDGIPPEDALMIARRQFGNDARLKERSREMWAFRWIDTTVKDIQYGCRMIKKNPGFAGVIVLSLALAIGVNTAIFSLADAVLLKTLPVKNPDQLVLFGWSGPRNVAITGHSGYWSTDRKTGLSEGSSLSSAMFEQMQRQNQTLNDLFAFYPISTNLNVSVHNQAEIASGQFVSGGYYKGLGASPIIGRTIGEEDDKAGADPVAVITYDYWKERFGRDPAIIGQPAYINGLPFTIVGITQPGFDGAAGVVRSADVSMPLAFVSEVTRKPSRMADRSLCWLRIMGRLKPGVAIEQARANFEPAVQQCAMEALREDLAKHPSPELESAVPPNLTAISGSQGEMFDRRNYGKQLYMLLIIVGLVLLIACINVANLLLARAGARQKEIAARIALGAGRLRLIRQLLTESLLFAAAGGLAGLLLATTKGFLRGVSLTGGSPLTVDMSLDLRILAFSAVVSIATGILFGIAPAIRATGIDPGPALKENAAAQSGGRSRFGLGKILIVAQVGLSLVVLVGAALFLQTLRNLQHVDYGFDAHNVLLFDVNPSLNGYKGERLGNFYQQVAERLDNIPGVKSASISLYPMLKGWGWGEGTPKVPGAKKVPDPEEHVYLFPVRDNFFDTMRIPLLAGRRFDSRDAPGSTKVAIVNQAFVRLCFDDDAPVGQHFQFNSDDGPRVFEVAGIVKDSIYQDLRRAPRPIVYFPFQQQMDEIDSMGEGMTYEVRAAGDPNALVPAIREVVRSIDSKVPVVDVKTQIEQIDEIMGRERAYAGLTAALGVLVLVLAGLGLYGVMAYNVTRRTREIGIKMALGAGARRVLGNVMLDTIALVIVGIAFGIAGTYAATRYISATLIGLDEERSLLFGVTPHDPAGIALAALFMLAVAVLAGYLPARRAARVDPLVALRYE
jgi:predicted permease